MDVRKKLQNVIAKLRSPITKLEVKLKVIGVFNLPEELQLQQDQDPPPAEYQIFFPEELRNVQFLGGRLQKKQEKPENSEPESAAKEEDEKEEKEQIQNYEDIYSYDSVKWYLEEQQLQEQNFQVIDDSLIAFEQAVEDAGGFWAELKRIPSEEQEKGAKKKAGKQEVVLEIKAKAWVSLEGLWKVNSTDVIIDAKLQDQEWVKPETPQEEKKGKKEEIIEPLRCLTGSGAYLKIQIILDQPISPEIKDEMRVSSILPKIDQLPKFVSTQEATVEFRNQIKGAVKAMNQIYIEQVNEESEDKRGLNVNQQKELREKRKEHFLYDFNTTGKYTSLKEKLRKSMAQIVRDKFRKSELMNGMKPEFRDQFYSELYAYFVEQMQQAVDEQIQEKREEMHEDIVLTRDLTNKEKETLLQNALKETPDERYSRLLNEYDINGDFERAVQWTQNRIINDSQNVQIWMDYCRLCLRNADISRAEICIRNIQEISKYSDMNYCCLHAAILLSRKRFQETKDMLDYILSKQVANLQANLLYSLLYHMTDYMGMSKKYITISQRIVMRQLGYLGKKGKSSVQELPKKLSVEETDDMYYNFMEWLISEKLLFLAYKVKEYIQLKQQTITRFSYNLAQLFFWNKDYRQCLEQLNTLLQKDKQHEQGYILKGHSLYFLNQGYDAEDCYLKAIRLHSRKGSSLQTSQKPKKYQEQTSQKKTFQLSESKQIDLTVYFRLGYGYLKRRAWKDAKQVFLKCCEDHPIQNCSVWWGLGLACLRLGEFQEAEDALNQANILDNLNPNVWGSLALLALHCTQEDNPSSFRYYQAISNIKEALKFKLQDKSVWKELGDLLLSKFLLSQGSELIILCYQEAAKCKGEPEDILKSIQDVFQKVQQRVEGNKELIKKIDKFYQEVKKQL